MNAGLGNIAFTGRDLPSGAPFPAGSADNGLSVDPVTGRIVLGGDVVTPAPLLNNRYIDMSGFQITYQNALAGKYFSIEPGNQFYLIGDQAGTGNGMRLVLDDANGLATIESNFWGIALLLSQLLQTYQLGDTSGIANATKLIIDDLNRTFIMGSNLGQALNLNMPTGSYQIGDVLGNVNNTILNINDASQFIRAGSLGAMMMLDFGNQSYEMGDLGNFAGGMEINLNALNDRTQIKDAAAVYLDIDGTTGGDLYQFGNLLLGNQISISNNTFQQRFLGNNFLEIDTGTNNFSFGDIAATANGNFLIINDTANEFRINNTATNAKIRMNGVLGFTGTVTPVVSITVNGGIVTNVT